MSSWSQTIIFYNNDSINAIDKNNNKIGFWKLYDLKRNITVSGKVKDNQKFKEVDYIIDGKLFATQKQDSLLMFYKEGSRVKAKLSRKNKKLSVVLENGGPLDKETQTKFFQAAEIPNMFYGGATAITAYIERYRNKSPLKNMYGSIVVEFATDIDGNVDGIMIVNSSNPALNSEVIKLIKSMPRWQPGFQQGHFVRVVTRLPINFT
jgi:TonB family protein